MKSNDLLTEIQKGVKTYKVFAELEEIVSELQNLDQVKEESLNAIKTSQMELQKLQVQIAEAVAEVDAAKVEAKTIRANAKEKADAKIAEAEKKATDVIEMANVALGAVEQKALAMKDEASAAVSERNAAQAELGNLTSQIEKMKTQFRGFMEIH